MKKFIIALCFLASGLVAEVKQPDFDSKEWQDKFHVNSAGLEDGWNACGCKPIPWEIIFPDWHRANAIEITKLAWIYKIGFEDGVTRCKTWKIKLSLATDKK